MWHFVYPAPSLFIGVTRNASEKHKQAFEEDFGKSRTSVLM